MHFLLVIMAAVIPQMMQKSVIIRNSMSRCGVQQSTLFFFFFKELIHSSLWIPPLLYYTFSIIWIINVKSPVDHLQNILKYHLFYVTFRLLVYPLSSANSYVLPEKELKLMFQDRYTIFIFNNGFSCTYSLCWHKLILG